MGGRGSSGLDRCSSGRGCGARYRRRAAPPPRAAARGTASALRLSPAVAARRAPGGEAGAHARAGLAGQYGVGPRTTATCSASSASSHETMLLRVRAFVHERRSCTLAARDLLRRTDAPRAIVKFEFSRPAVLLVRQAAPGLRCLPQPAGAAKKWSRARRASRRSHIPCILPQILGSQPEVIRSECHHHHLNSQQYVPADWERVWEKYTHAGRGDDGVRQ